MDIGALKSILSRRGIKSIYYFHTDHWEPWSTEDKTHFDIEHVERFIQHHERFNHSKKLTLNYKVGFPKYKELNSKTMMHERMRFVEGDYLGFLVPQEGENEDSRIEMIRQVEEKTNHELQIHIHHERITSGDYFTYSPEIRESEDDLFKKDELRLDFFIKMLLSQFEKETGRKPENWTFVHGLWALNASDTKVCNNINEIEILMKNGCIADFSMPSGRWIVDSDTRTPFTCLPVSAPKGYDFAEADKTPLNENISVPNDRRFLIWNQEIPYTYSSLDYSTKDVSNALRDTIGFLKIWFENGYCIDGKLFIKTHGHSMNSNFDPLLGNEFPLCYPDTVKIFQMMEDVCTDMRIELNYSTANEVIEELSKIDKNLKSHLEDGAIVRRNVASIRHFNRNFVPDMETQISLIVENEDLFNFSSLGSYYGIRKERKAMFTFIDVELAKYISQKFDPEIFSIFEMGPGIGNSLILLSNLGFDCQGVEAHMPRFEYSQILQNSLVNAGSMDVQYGIFPQVDIRKNKNKFNNEKDILSKTVKQLKAICRNLKLSVSGKKSELIERIVKNQPRGKETVFICTNIISGATANNQDAIMNAMSEHNHIIIDLGSFGIPRVGAEREDLMKEFNKYGFKLKSYVLGGDYHLRDRNMIAHLSK